MTVHIDELDFALPDELIATHPTDKRSAARLLVHDHQHGVRHHTFSDLPDLLSPNDLLVLNNSYVRPSRTYATKGSRSYEVLWYRKEEALWKAVGQTRKLRVGDKLDFSDDSCATVMRIDGDTMWLDAPHVTDIWLHEHAVMALPPYLLRQRASGEVETRDQQDYQLAYAAEGMSIAAPTAGLHFDDALLERLRDVGIQTATVRLDVGPGTFRPIRTDNIEHHQIEPEWVQIDAKAVETIQATKESGGRVIAVGTTSVRTLEGVAALHHGTLSAYRGDIAIAIFPGHQFRVVDAIITNFHQPKSSLMALVAAFAGLQTVRAVYTHAVEQRYRFYSYGDATLWLSNKSG